MYGGCKEQVRLKLSPHTLAKNDTYSTVPPLKNNLVNTFQAAFTLSRFYCLWYCYATVCTVNDCDLHNQDLAFTDPVKIAKKFWKYKRQLPKKMSKAQTRGKPATYSKLKIKIKKLMIDDLMMMGWAI